MFLFNGKAACTFGVGIVIASIAITTPAVAHPGSGIAVDRSGQIYFMDTGSGLWKIDVQGKLIRLGGPLFHWMAIDQDDRFSNVRLPAGSGGDIVRIGSNPTVLASSDYPIAIGLDGNLYYPVHGPERRVQIMRLTPQGQTSVLGLLPANGASGQPLRDLNGLTAAPDGSLYYAENGAVGRITMEGKISLVVPNVHLSTCSAVPGMTEHDNPLLRGLQVDSTGTIYVAASGCGSVLKIMPGRPVTTISRVTGPWSPTAIAVFGGTVYALEYLHTAVETSRSRAEWIPRVRRITSDGQSAIVATVRRP